MEAAPTVSHKILNMRNLRILLVSHATMMWARVRGLCWCYLLPGRCKSIITYPAASPSFAVTDGLLSLQAARAPNILKGASTVNSHSPAAINMSGDLGKTYIPGFRLDTSNKCQSKHLHARPWGALGGYKR